MRFYGFFFGLVLTFVMAIIGIIMIIIGGININNTNNPNLTPVQANRISTTKGLCKVYNKRNGTCNTYHPSSSIYNTDMCSNMSRNTTLPGDALTVEYDIHKNTGECRTPKISSNESIFLLVFGVIFILLSTLIGYCTYRDDCRMFLGFFSFFSNFNN